MVEGVFEKRVNKIYATEEIIAPLEPIVEDLEQKLIASRSFDITRDFLFLMFLKPQITQQLHWVSAKTVDSYDEAVITKDPKLVKEWGFFVVNRKSEGFFATEAPEIPAAYDLPVPEIKTVKDSKSQTMVMIHTHPPMDSVLIPSTIVQTEARKDVRSFAGDLYAFLRMRELSMGKKRGAFIERPLSLILQDHAESVSTKMLFIRQSKELPVLNPQEYIKELQRNRRRMNKSKDEQTVQKILADLGFNSSYLRLPMTQFYNYPSLWPDQVYAIVEELELNL